MVYGINILLGVATIWEREIQGLFKDFQLPFRDLFQLFYHIRVFMAAYKNH